jgi:hypothetical protein
MGRRAHILILLSGQDIDSGERALGVAVLSWEILYFGFEK